MRGVKLRAQLGYVGYKGDNWLPAIVLLVPLCVHLDRRNPQHWRLFIPWYSMLQLGSSKVNESLALV